MFANIGNADDARLAVEQGAEGVGLLRTEFLFHDRATPPSEDEQVAALTEIAERLQGRPLIVRTLDAGADKPLPFVAHEPEANPFLGKRGIRVSLEQPELFSAQLRAILRVAAEHPLSVMFPMVSTVAELQAARRLLDAARAELGSDAPLEVGVMIEVPAAALQAEQLAPHLDFFSIGTNDLSQYTMAAERGNPALAGLLKDALEPVLILIAQRHRRRGGARPLGRRLRRARRRPGRRAAPGRARRARTEHGAGPDPGREGAPARCSRGPGTRVALPRRWRTRT